MAFQRHTWIVQRIGWAIMALILIAAVLGITGGGPLSRASATSSDGLLTVEYERFGRVEGPTVLRLQAIPGEDGSIHVWFDHTYISQVQVEQIMPVPKEEQTSADRVSYVFAAPDRLHPAPVTFRIKLLKSGWLSGRVGMRDASSLTLQQFIFP